MRGPKSQNVKSELIDVRMCPKRCPIARLDVTLYPLPRLERRAPGYRVFFLGGKGSHSHSHGECPAPAIMPRSIPRN
jgi:hypothetical protein